jgi:hypothetical protein
MYNRLMHDNEKPLPDRRAYKDSWHLDRRVPLSLIVSVALIIGHQIWQNATNNAKFIELEKNVVLLASDRIHAATVAEMFRSRDIQIDHLETTLRDFKGELIEYNRLLRMLVDQNFTHSAGGDLKQFPRTI